MATKSPSISSVVFSPFAVFSIVILSSSPSPCNAWSVAPVIISTLFFSLSLSWSLFSPVKKSTYLLSYLLSGLPLTFLQTVLFLAISFIFGLPFDFNALLILVYLLPSQLFYLTVGISRGSLCKNEKQSGPMSSIIISLSCMLGGVFMPVTTFTGAFKTVLDILPFAHTVQIASEIYNVGAGCILSHLPFVLGYTLALWLVIVLVNLSKRK